MNVNWTDTTDNQFGLKEGHSTDHCIFALKNILQYYKSNNSPVYSCFLDASKAFDRVNYWTLFRKVCACCTYTYSVVLVQNPNVLYQMGFYNIRVF